MDNVKRLPSEGVSPHPQAFDLPETEMYGRLLGQNRQDLFLSMHLETADGHEQQHRTPVSGGVDGTVEWGGDAFSFILRDAGEAVVVKVCAFLTQSYVSARGAVDGGGLGVVRAYQVGPNADTDTCPNLN